MQKNYTQVQITDYRGTVESGRELKGNMMMVHWSVLSLVLDINYEAKYT